MVKLHFGRILKIPVKLNQTVWYIDDGGQLAEGVIHSIDIYYLDSGKAVDVDFVVHPIVNGHEDETMEPFSDFDLGVRLFKTKRRGKKFLHGRKAQK